MARSLGFATDLALLRASGSHIVRTPECTVVRTPANPTFWWGNFLLLPQAPAPAEVDRWMERFGQEFPEAEHLALGVDEPHAGPDALIALAERGLDVEAAAVLTIRDGSAAVPDSPGTDVEIRPLTSRADWSASVALRMRTDTADGHRTEGHESFVERRVAANRDLVERGLGRWFGAFADGDLAAELGLVGAGGTTARFQYVQTDPAYRRRGLATTLLARALDYGFGELGAEILVIVADPDYHAITLYERVGFVRTEVQLQAQRASRITTAAR